MSQLSFELNFWISILLLVSALFALTAVFKRDLMMLQLNSYRNERYSRWFNQSNESTAIFRIIACIALFLILVRRFPFFFTGGASAIALIWIAIVQFRKKYKKPLVFTKRAVRIYVTMWVLSAIIIVLPAGLTMSVYNGCATAILLVIVSPLILLASNLILRPVEQHINRKYYNEAKAILQSMPDLKIVGVTGSYGKTSTKHYLHRILSEKYDVMMTPGSYNTTLGVIRTVREYLKPYNEVFIVEMGAKQRGDIKEICDLAHPSIGIVTAVGEQHLESFKTIENIRNTKFELIDSLPADGLAVVNNDFPMSATREVKNVECIRYGVSNADHADLRAVDIVMDERGTTFTVEGAGEKMRLHTKLVGECNISNLLAAIAVALRLGVEPEKIAYAVEKIEQVEHRLNIKRIPGGLTIIDDAFNSNPTGSKMAIDVLSVMNKGKRIVITPGMIELGEKQYELNKEFGKKMAGNCDIVIIVGEYNRYSILEGLEEGGMDKNKILTSDTFAQAQAELAKIATAGDTVLYENDLPDTFK